MEYTHIYSLSDPNTGEIRYVGKTYNQLRKRLYSHLNECKSGNKSHKINWIKSLLSNNEIPVISIIDTVPTNQWQFWEQYWIEQFKQWGFNLTNIAKGGYDNSYKRSDKTKEKMRSSKLGTKLSVEHKKNISDSVKLKAKENALYNRGKGNSKSIIEKELLYQKYIIENLSLNKCASFFGFSKKKIFLHITEYGFKKEKSEWKKQLSTGQKVVLQYDMSGIFIKQWDSVFSITKEYGYNSGNIYNCCRGVVLSVNGYIWRYKDDFLEIDLNKLNYQKRKIKQYDMKGNFIKSYDSIKEAASFGFNDGNIQDCCVYRLKSHKGFIWRYIEDNNPVVYDNKNKRAVLQYDMSGSFIKEWDSIVTVSKELKIGSNNIITCCSGKSKSSGGFIWKYKI